MIFSRITTLSIALNKVNNKLINRGIQNREELFNLVLADTEAIEKSLLHLTEHSTAALKDPNFTRQGQQAQVQKLQRVTSEQVAAANKREAFATGVEGHEKSIQAIVDGTRKKNRPALETVISAMEQAEIRKTMADTLRRSRQDHEERLAKAQDKGQVLPKAMQVFRDPVVDFYLTACNSYDGSQEAFMRALDQAPWPLGVIDQDTITEGSAILQGRLAPDELAQWEAAKIRLEAHEAVLLTANEIIQNPTGTTVYSETRKVKPDGPDFDLPTVEDVEEVAG
ncbi:MAG: NAD-dependent DNA ligase [Desulforhopalus sp.]|jgi:NAD-dependent DNA ligase